MNRYRLLRHMSFALSGLVALALVTSAHAKSTPANLTWSLAQFDFGSVSVGNTPTETFTLTNTGHMSSGTITVTESGSAAFIITANGCAGKALGGGKSCNVTVEYGPINTNGDTGTLSANGEVGSASLGLFGNGGPNVVLSPGQFVGTTGGTKDYIYNNPFFFAQTLTVSNTGTSTSETLMVELTGQFMVFVDGCTGNTLAANGSCSFEVAFPPSGCGASGTPVTGLINVVGTSRTYINLQLEATCP